MGGWLVRLSVYVFIDSSVSTRDVGELDARSIDGCREYDITEVEGQPSLVAILDRASPRRSGHRSRYVLAGPAFHLRTV